MRVSTAIAAGLLAGTATLGAVPAAAQIYVTAETGWSWASNAGLDDRDGYTAATCQICVPGSLDELGDSPFVGLGVGYRVSDLLRADVILSYRGGYGLDDRDSAGVDYDADVRSLALMLNGYVDLPVEAFGVRPYLTAGIGVARNRTSSIHQSWSDDPFVPPGTQDDPGGGATAFVWSLGAGASATLAEGIVLDVGYRYVDLGRLETDRGTSTYQDETTPAFGYASNGLEGHLRASEVRVALRYQF
ncbi:outer membrane protein [Azospirillum sp. ST 5-10]|uniref:outer membrane protein n=1 Tax=unclassified Azospirillum TaxID=2630922 RepID=UPI003F49F784